MHYAWVILICCCLIELGSFGAIGNCLGLYVTPVCNEFQIKTATFTSYITIKAISLAGTATICGKIIKKIGTKKALIFSGCLNAFLFIGLGLAQSIQHFYIIAVFVGYVFFF